jgi:hypothetical protein
MNDNPLKVEALDETAIDAHGSVNAARFLARERQKQELRRERDAIVVALARDFGEGGLAESLGVSGAVVGKLVAGARERLGEGPDGEGEPQITVRRLGADSQRWAEVDAHYEALGSGPSLTDRRGAPRRF